MKVAVMLDSLKTANFNGLRLAAKDLDLARRYWASSLRQFDELAGRGLQPADPIEYAYQHGWVSKSAADRVVLPPLLETPGGTRIDELFVLGATTAVLKPKRVFEIGTFEGRTTSVFILNAPASADVLTLDLPADSDANAANIDSDVTLIKERKLGKVLRGLGLDSRYRQLLDDSLAFDPAPYAGSVELGFIDGAHARHYVENDTRKMAVMMADRGLVFWHDYGGKGRFRELTEYLNSLGSTIQIYRVAETTLAWAPASELKRLI
jgi:hypothetical protein